MKIVRCSKCNKYIHKARKCFHCGNTMGFDEMETPSIHENVVTEYAKVEFLIENKKFTEALVLSHIVIEWMPNLAGIFWLRLLAKNECTSSAELIRKGFKCEEDADFLNALSFSSGAEHSAYLDIQNIVVTASKTLKAEVLKHEYNCKLRADVLRIKKNMQSEMETRKNRLFMLWSDLEKIEHALYNLEMDCRLLTKEHSNALDAAVQAASSMKMETYRLEECTTENLYKYRVKIGSILEQSELAKDDIESMRKQHPWVNSFNGLVVKRDEQVQLIGNELSSLRSYEATIQQTLNEIDKIEKQHRNVVRAVEAYEFQDAAVLLGEESFNQVFCSIGLRIDVQLPFFKKNEQLNKAYNIQIIDDNNINGHYNALDPVDDSYEKVEKVISISQNDSVSRASEMSLTQKVYPNDSCPCGSGKRYKQCCGRKIEVKM